MSPVGFLDESPQLEGRRFNGYPIFGGHWKLPRLLKTMKIDQIVISDGKVQPEVLKRLKETSRIHGIPVLQLKMQLDDAFLSARQPQPTRPFEIHAERAKGQALEVIQL
jgi:FlaA1/EpsC-like NDP-sugar epimerase